MGGGGGSITIFRQNFFVSQCRIFRRGIFLVFHYFRVSKIVRDKSGGGGPAIFRRNCFCLRVPRHFFVAVFFWAVFKKFFGR